MCYPLCHCSVLGTDGFPISETHSTGVHVKLYVIIFISVTIGIFCSNFNGEQECRNKQQKHSFRTKQEANNNFPDALSIIITQNKFKLEYWMLWFSPMKKNGQTFWQIYDSVGTRTQGSRLTRTTGWFLWIIDLPQPMNWQKLLWKCPLEKNKLEKCPNHKKNYDYPYPLKTRWVSSFQDCIHQFNSCLTDLWVCGNSPKIPS